MVNKKVKDAIVEQAMLLAWTASTLRAIHRKGDTKSNPKDRESLRIEMLPYMRDSLNLEWFEGLPSERNELLSTVAERAKELAKNIAEERDISKEEAFGYAAKVIALYMRQIITHRDILNDKTAKMLRPLCPSPIDSYVFKGLSDPPHDKIKNYDTKSWLKIQTMIADYCKKEENGYDPMDFDYIVWTEKAKRQDT